MAKSRTKPTDPAFAATMARVDEDHRLAFHEHVGDGRLEMDDGERILPSELDAWYAAHPGKVQFVFGPGSKLAQLGAKSTEAVQRRSVCNHEPACAR